MSAWIIRQSLGQRLALCLGRKRQRDQAKKETGAHRYSCESPAHHLPVTAEDTSCEQVQCQWSRRSKIAADVVTKRCSRAAQARGKELRKINGVAAEHGKNAEAE